MDGRKDQESHQKVTHLNGGKKFGKYLCRVDRVAGAMFG
jgi:hypothetical protein